MGIGMFLDDDLVRTVGVFCVYSFMFREGRVYSSLYSVEM